jgi:cobalt-zinc-cadmium efflux system membrane fusion protein
MKTSSIVLAVLALLELTMIAGCGSQAVDAVAIDHVVPERTDVSFTAEQIAHAGIRWVAAEAASESDAIEVPGQLAPNEDRTARLGAPARARVQTLHVHMGSRVSRGQALVTLVGEEAAAARAEHAKAIADLNAHRVAARYARAALDRADRLLELKAISRQDVERARVDYEVAEAARMQSEAEVERAGTTLSQLGVSGEGGEMVIRAPLGGIVLSRDVVPGSVVNAGDPLLMITDPSILWLEIAATERVAPLLREGSRVSFTVPELMPRTFDAVIEGIGAALDPATRTLPMHATVANPDGRLRPAMFATILLPLGEARQGVRVPDAAVQLLDQKPVLFVASPDPSGGARFERRDVEIGARRGRHVHIVGGVKPGEIVVTEGAFAVKSELARTKMPVG